MPAPFATTDAMLDNIRHLPGLNMREDPGAASSFQAPGAIPAALWNYGGLIPLGAAAAGLWYLNNQPQQQKKKAPKDADEKQADLKDVINSIVYHLPKIRPVDTAAGLVAGGAAGGLYDWLKGTPKGERSRKLKRILTGALVGAGGANLAGDRTRRYVSNMVPPYGKGYGPDTVKQLIPGYTDDKAHAATRGWAGWSRDATTDLRDALVLDKPRFKNYAQAVTDPEAGRSKIPAPVYADVQSGRDEIVRRQFGLPVRDPGNPIWQKNPEGYYSLNERSPEYERRLKSLFGSIRAEYTDRYRVAKNYKHWKPDLPTLRGRTHEQLLANPVATLTDLNKPAPSKTVGLSKDLNREIRFFGGDQLMGDQQLPFKVLPDGSISGQTLDRWDLTPSKPEMAHLRSALLKMFSKKWRDAPAPQFGTYVRPTTDTNASAAKNIGARWLWDNVLSDELPWVSQKFHMAPAPRTLSAPIAPGYTMQFLKNDNSPATDAMNAPQLKDWMAAQ
jgi:hypothetical protein